MTGVHAYIGVGSNLGDRFSYCLRAIDRLAAIPEVSHLTRSSFYETEPLGDPNQGWFLNFVISIETTLTAERLFAHCVAIERDLGRLRTGFNTPRTIDLDILLYGSEIVHTASLIVPHPRMEHRRFVLAPLAELSPDFRHPVLQLTMQELLTRLTDPHIVKRLDGYGPP